MKEYFLCRLMYSPVCQWFPLNERVLILNNTIGTATPCMLNE